MFTMITVKVKSFPCMNADRVTSAEYDVHETRASHVSSLLWQNV